jgi:CBS domain-containing protein
MPTNGLYRSDVVTTDPETDVATIAETMRTQNVGSVVVTEGRVPVGIVTDRDLAVRVLAERADPETVTAGDVMSEGLYTLDRDAGFEEAAEMMGEHGVRRLPVVSGDELVGIVTLGDLSERLEAERHHLAEATKQQRRPYFD